MPSSSEIAVLFSSIARRYDFLNHFLSLNMDRLWRRKLIRLAGVVDGARVLDLCTGTGDILVGFAGSSDSVRCVGIDISDKMLEIAERKVEKRELSDRVELICTDAMEIPFDDDTFDVICIGFGLRNLPDAAKGVGEMTRVLKKGGRLLILEFSPVQRGLLGWLYNRLYLKHLIPLAGGCISGSRSAYKYLATSVEGFLAPEKVKVTLQENGLREIKAIPLTSGIAYIYEATK